MPINIPDKLPAVKTLESENIFVMKQTRAHTQDIRPLEIAIMNLMPDKITTESQLLRLLGNTPLQIEITLLHPKTHESKNTSKDHIGTFYKTFEEIKNKKFDGLVITGAPVEHLDFEQVDYWEELKQVMDWSKHNVTSTIHICWGAQAGLYYHYGIKKYHLKEKIFGIFLHHTTKKNVKLLRGFDEEFFVPQSRHTEVRKEEILKIKELEILAESKETGVHLIATRDGKQVFVTGHSEYDGNTLKREYNRDKANGLNIDLPKNYFPENDSTKEPALNWRAHANLTFCNWLNYCVYQQTPYKIEEIK